MGSWKIIAILPPRILPLQWPLGVKDHCNLLIEHKLQVTMGISDRIAVLDYGKKIAARLHARGCTRGDYLAIVTLGFGAIVPIAVASNPQRQVRRWIMWNCCLRKFWSLPASCAASAWSTVALE